MFQLPKTRSPAVVVAVAFSCLLLVASAAAQQRDPTPKELWDAYPLQPEEAPAVPTPGSDVPEPVASPRAAAVVEPDDGGGLPWFVVIMLATPLVVAAAMLLSDRRRRRPAPVTAEQIAPPAIVKNGAAFDWRVYPPPARPAPPAPPSLKGGE